MSVLENIEPMGGAGVDRYEVTITNGHRYAVHIIGRRFRPGIPRTLILLEKQLKTVRGNPWLWIEGEDYDAEPDDDGNVELPSGSRESEMPAKSEKKGVWVEYAETAYDLDVEGLSKKEIIARVEEAEADAEEESEETEEEEPEQ